MLQLLKPSRANIRHYVDHDSELPMSNIKTLTKEILRWGVIVTSGGYGIWDANGVLKEYKDSAIPESHTSFRGDC